MVDTPPPDLAQIADSWEPWEPSLSHFCALKILIVTDLEAVLQPEAP